jgi:hypothetical protein
MWWLVSVALSLLTFNKKSEVALPLHLSHLAMEVFCKHAAKHVNTAKMLRGGVE